MTASVYFSLLGLVVILTVQVVSSSVLDDDEDNVPVVESSESSANNPFKNTNTKDGSPAPKTQKCKSQIFILFTSRWLETQRFQVSRLCDP